MSDSFEDREKAEREQERAQLKSRIERLSAEKGLGVASLDAVTDHVLDDGLRWVVHIVTDERIAERLAVTKQARPDLFVPPTPAADVNASGPKDPEFRKFLGGLAKTFDNLPPATRTELLFKFQTQQKNPSKDPAERVVNELVIKHGPDFLSRASKQELLQLQDAAGLPRGPAKPHQTAPITIPVGLVGERKLSFLFMSRQKAEAEQRLAGFRRNGDSVGVERTEREIESLRLRLGGLL